MVLTLPQALERIAELEALLEHAVYVKLDEWEKVRQALPVSQSEACILVALWKAGIDGLTSLDMDAVLPDCLPRGNKRKDPDFRTLETTRVFVHRARVKCPGLLFGQKGSRYARTRLTEEGMRVVGEALCR